ncbi:MAG: hypothetical protein BYD32DRAFT_460438 [Podila humilis]|nr:MAG: hypothetical protein BYD32DRAFT_460438 [Podila humilis]
MSPMIGATCKNAVSSTGPTGAASPQSSIRNIVLVHGTTAHAFENWLYIRPRLDVQGYCSFALTYGARPDNPLFVLNTTGASPDIHLAK